MMPASNIQMVQQKKLKWVNMQVRERQRRRRRRRRGERERKNKSGRENVDKREHLVGLLEGHTFIALFS